MDKIKDLKKVINNSIKKLNKKYITPEMILKFSLFLKYNLIYFKNKYLSIILYISYIFINSNN